jgi:hypothetical protein
MKYFTPFLLLFFTSCEKKTKEYNFPEIGWSINIPSSYILVDSMRAMQGVHEGENMIRNAYTRNLHFATPMRLLKFENHEKMGGICFGLDNIDSFKEEKSFNELVQFDNDHFFTGFKKGAEDRLAGSGTVEMDSTTSIETIDNMQFIKFYSVINISNAGTMYLVRYSKLINGYYFNIWLTYAKDDFREEIMQIINTSKFDTTHCTR